ncbi:DNA repair protein RecO [Balneolales bacterium ANBcel1]|nr:DNA repair protein RecO [Balneolales bacterium ANBcel1]
MLVDTSAIILKTIPFRESSLIVTLLSKEHGKIAVMARGARRHKNKFGGLLQPGFILDVTYYYKPTRDVQNIGEVVQQKATWRIHEQMEKMAVAMVTLELCEQLCHEHEPMPEIFDFLAEFLPWLHATEFSPKNLFPYIQFRLAQLTGIGIFEDSGNAAPAGNDPDGMSGCYLNVESGNLSPNPAGGLHFRLTKSQYRYLRCILDGRKAELLTDTFPVGDIRNMIHHMDVYLQYHMEGLKARRSDSIFQQILN